MDENRAFRARFLRYLLPQIRALSKPERWSVLPYGRRIRSVRRAADLSLTSAAGKTAWSRSLRCHILRRTRRRGFRPTYATVRKTRRSSTARKATFNSPLQPTTQPVVSGVNSGEALLSDPLRMAAFRGLIPGGQLMDLPHLLEQAAHYILSLQMQVESLNFLLSHYSPEPECSSSL